MTDAEDFGVAARGVYAAVCGVAARCVDWGGSRERRGVLCVVVECCGVVECDARLQRARRPFIAANAWRSGPGRRSMMRVLAEVHALLS